MAVLAIAAACLTGAEVVFAQPSERPDQAVFVENDVLSGTDRHYTNGLRYQRTRGEAAEAPWWAR